MHIRIFRRLSFIGSFLFLFSANVVHADSTLSICDVLDTSTISTTTAYSTAYCGVQSISGGKILTAQSTLTAIEFNIATNAGDKEYFMFTTGGPNFVGQSHNDYGQQVNLAGLGTGLHTFTLTTPITFPAGVSPSFHLYQSGQNGFGDILGNGQPHSQMYGSSVSNDQQAVFYQKWFWNPSIAPPDPCIAINTCVSNVLFLPGIEASRLYRPDGNGEDRLWEPSSDADAGDLSMTGDGGSVRNDIYTKDVMDEAYGTFNVYKSFIDQINALATGTSPTIKEWEAIPYDWRLTLDDILNYGNRLPNGRLYYSGNLRATSTPYVMQELRRLAASSKTGKVTIVAHSNGGLVAKALMQKLGPDAANLVDKIIFIASPQVGTPSAIGALLHGYDQGIPVTLSDAAARSVSQNMPSVYNLLPSSNYFTRVDDPTITFDPTTLPDWVAKYGGLVHSTERLRAFMADTTRIKPTYDDVTTPEVSNSQLFDAAQGMHASLDVWTPPQGVKIIQIAGWGNETLSGIAYRKVHTCVPGTFLCTAYKLTFSPEHAIDGDGTVIAPSALWMSTTTGAEDYWVNLPEYNADHVIEATPLGRKHRDILEIPQLRTLIANLLIATTTAPLPQYVSAIQPTYFGDGDRLHFTLHSPLTLGFTDANGNYAGATATSTASTVPGVVYERYGDVQWLSVPASMSGQVVMRGTGPGSFTLDAERASGGAIVATTSFEGIPSSTSTVATIDLDPSRSVTASSTLVVDENGDGTPDMALQAREGSVVTPDITPPELRITFSTTTQTLAFIGTDDSGIVTVTATSTYPLFRNGNKNYSGTATTTVTARDGAGNTTRLVYARHLPSPAQRDTIVLKEIAYNGATTTIASTTLSYKWRQNKDGTYKLFASRLQTVATSTESHYRSKKGITIIVTKPREFDDGDFEDDTDGRPIKQTLPGMVVPYIQTEKGRMIIES